jgi:hypothetical protein
METSECLKLQKSFAFAQDFGSGLIPSIALGVTPAKRLKVL